MSQTKVQYIYVVDSNGEPVMPTSRLGMVRRWLKSGQAIWYGNSRKTIQFVRPITTHTQKLTLGVDAGFHLGLSVVGNHREYYSAESIRKSEKNKLTARRELRRTRRSRLRHRQARFNNRKREVNWLATSIQHRLDFTIKEIKRVYSFLPVTNLVVEVAPFDNQKLINPKIKPWEYTQGKMHGYKTIKEYLLARDNYRDALDGKQYPASQLRVHHLIQRKDGGTNQPDNLVLLSNVHHNQANHVNGTLAQIRDNRQKTIDYQGAYFMSVLATRLSNYFNNYTTTQGYITANLRHLYQIEKSHRNDAFVIAGGTNKDSRTINAYLRTKIANNNRVLQKFYDAKYIDSRDGKKKSSKKLSSGRTRRSREIPYDNQRIFRKEKVTKGRVSIRRNHYRIRPHDIVLNTKTNQIEIAKGVQNRGTAVKFLTNKTVSISKAQCLYHVNGLKEEQIKLQEKVSCNQTRTIHPTVKTADIPPQNQINMLTIQGFNIEDFIDYNPPKNTIAISFASKLDHQYDQQLYAKLPDAYTKYRDHLVILADDIPINRPNPEYQLFTNNDAQNVINFVNKYPNSNIVVHCNAGVSRTGTIVKFLANHYNYQITGQQSFAINPLINNLLHQIYKRKEQ